MLGAINGAGVALMTSIGHRTGLFDAMAALPPSTSARVAEAAGLNERYVREWLGAMTTGGVLEHDPADNTFYLPPEHAAFLTRAASPNNLAVTTQFVAVLGGVEDRIVECFRQGGGVPYSAFTRFHETMAEESEQTVVAGLRDSILPLAPGLTDSLRAGIEVLDVGCGSGRALNTLAADFPASRFTGYDLSEEAVASARREAERRGLSNVRFEVRDVTQLGEGGRFQLVTAFDAIHDQARPALVLRGIAEALRPGGTFLMQDIRGSRHVEKNLGHPVAPFLYTISAMHCMTVSLAAGGDGLGTMWGEETAVEMLLDAGFREVHVEQLPHDFMNNFYIALKS
jgi:2-polyprenyl-3-methyl-5-hydroxy-6-metoxy-1,4-benzoquinol methylase